MLYYVVCDSSISIQYLFCSYLISRYNDLAKPAVGTLGSHNSREIELDTCTAYIAI